ncbi:MAG: elongation factor G [Bacillota bacterium]
MRKYATDHLRNIGLIAHGGAGKTSLAEAMLFSAKAIDRLGRVEDGTAAMDYDPEEVKRKVTISAAVAPVEWHDCKVNIVDTPGYFDFVGEVKAALRIIDTAVVVIDAVAGVEVGTELVWRYANEPGLPRMVVVNKMDRENANFTKALETLTTAFGHSVVPLHLPIGQEAKFQGLIDLVKMKAYYYKTNLSGGFDERDIPADLAADAQTGREKLVEAAAEADDELLTKYLDGQELSPQEVEAGLRKGVTQGKVVPVMVASAAKNIGAQAVLEAIVNYAPSPTDRPAVTGVSPKTKAEESRLASETQPFAALVFKTMADPYVGRLTLFRVISGILKSDSHAYNANKEKDERFGQLFIPRAKQQEPVPEVVAGDIGSVAKLQVTVTGDTLCEAANPIVFPPIQFPNPVYAVAMKPKAKGDEEKISAGLARLQEEDPTFKVGREPVTGELLISGMGELHLDITTDRLNRKFQVSVTLDQPRVPYKETIRGKAKVEGKHKKQSGGRGQFGDVWVEFEPLPDQDFEFVDKIFGGSVPRQFIPAVEKGIRESMQEGVLAGYPMTNFRAILYDGKYHPVDSSEMAFKIAGSLALKEGAKQARPILLEPIVAAEVMVPDVFMGDVIGDLNKKRGKILGMEPQGTTQVIKALVPQAEMRRYAIDLRSITQGRGTFTMAFDHYEETPGHIAEAVIAEAKKAEEDEK